MRYYEEPVQYAALLCSFWQRVRRAHLRYVQGPQCPRLCIIIEPHRMKLINNISFPLAELINQTVPSPKWLYTWENRLFLDSSRIIKHCHWAFHVCLETAAALSNMVMMKKTAVRAPAVKPVLVSRNIAPVKNQELQKRGDLQAPCAQSGRPNVPPAMWVRLKKSKTKACIFICKACKALLLTLIIKYSAQIQSEWGQSVSRDYSCGKSMFRQQPSRKEMFFDWTGFTDVFRLHCCQWRVVVGINNTNRLCGFRRYWLWDHIVAGWHFAKLFKVW